MKVILFGLSGAIIELQNVANRTRRSDPQTFDGGNHVT
jgi:hypothetical protein